MVDEFTDLGAVMQEYINSRAPIYKKPPPVDDDRPNVTSWSYYKDRVPGQPFGKKGGH